MSARLWATCTLTQLAGRLETHCGRRILNGGFPDRCHSGDLSGKQRFRCRYHLGCQPLHAQRPASPKLSNLFVSRLMLFGQYPGYCCVTCCPLTRPDSLTDDLPCAGHLPPPTIGCADCPGHMDDSHGIGCPACYDIPRAPAPSTDDSTVVCKPDERPVRGSA